MGEKFLMLIKKIKFPHVMMLLHGLWFVEIYLALQVVLVVVIDNCMICGLITSSVICCAKCHFHPFLPFSSIS